MSLNLSRRAMLAGLSAGALFAPRAMSRTEARIVVIGGGFGGSTAARTLRHLLPNAEVTLVDPASVYTACPFSNLVLSGERPPEAQSFDLDGPGSRGISHVHALAEMVDPVSKRVALRGGASVSYDRLILSPGISMRWDGLSGYTEDAEARMPHAWKAGPQTQLLARQLENLEDGGVVAMSVPTAPYRCPPGPYERASLIAHFLKTRKPRSKLIVLDAKDTFSKMPLFQEAWAEHYPDHLEWRSAFDDGRVVKVDPEAMTIETDFDTLKVDVANVIPPQKAAAIAERAGVADGSGWCPINALTFESTLQAGIHVIGDAAIAAPMPKSAFSANLQGKVCAMQVARILSGLDPLPTRLVNTCYSYTTPDEAISIVGAYSNEGGVFRQIEGAGGVSPLGAETAVRTAEAAQAADWFEAITAESFG